MVKETLEEMTKVHFIEVYKGQTITKQNTILYKDGVHVMINPNFPHHSHQKYMEVRRA